MGDRIGTSGDTDSSWLKLSVWDFDQTEEGWRGTAHGGDFRGAARMIERYLEAHPEIGEQRLMHFHAGQMCAYAGDYPEALRHIKQSIHADEPPDTPVRWNAYVDATIAFLENDRERLIQCRQTISEGPAFDGEVPNLNVVDRLIEKFGKPYADAYG